MKKVAELQRFLRSLGEVLEPNAGSVAKELRNVCDKLGIFAEMSLTEFGKFLERAEDLYRNGPKPTRPSGSSRTKAPSDPDRVPKAVEALKAFLQICADPSITQDEMIARVVGATEGFSVPELKEVAKGIGISKIPSKKTDVEEAIRHRFRTVKGMVERSQV